MMKEKQKTNRVLTIVLILGRLPYFFHCIWQRSLRLRNQVR